MKPRLLFSYRSRLIGYFCIVAYIPLMVIKKVLHNGYNNQSPSSKLADATGVFNSEHILTAIALLLIMLGLLLIAFSKEKIEDEQISQLRLDCLQWAVYLNYFILMISVLFTSNMHLRDLMMLNLCVPLIFFIIRFRWKIWMLNRLLKKEQNLA